MIKKPLSKLKLLLLLLIVGVIGLVCISYIHAYRFTHFSYTSNPRTDPEDLTVIDKIGLIFTGIQNPHQEDLILPSRPYETFLIGGDKKLESWFIANEKNNGIIILYHG